MVHRRKECSFCTKEPGYRLKKYVELLKKIAFGERRARQAVLRRADPCLVNLLRECVLNFLYNKIQVPEEEKKRKLRRYAWNLTELVRPKTSLRRSRELLRQSGGFLPVILPALISLVTGIAGEAIGRSIANSRRSRT